MQINHLSIENFRNFARGEFEFSDRVFVSGRNGTGKSSLLESIYYLSSLKSFRQNGDSRLVRIGSEGFLINSSGEREDAPLKMGVMYADGKKNVSVNGERVKKATESFGVFLSAVISGYDKQLSGTSAGVRRRFCDRIISLIDPEYLAKLMEYYSLLRMRNAVLKNEGDDRQTAVYSNQMSERSVYIYERRLEFMEYLAGTAAEVYGNLLKRDANIEIGYFSSKDGGEYTQRPLSEVHASKRDEEKRRKRTTAGVHLDDFLITVDGARITEIGSEGERMLLGLAMKCAEIELIYENIGEHPVILLDDPFAEMDLNRTSGMLEHFMQYPQVIFASPNPGDNLHSFEIINLDEIRKDRE